jgi:hypothetical protein
VLAVQSDVAEESGRRSSITYHSQKECSRQHCCGRKRRGSTGGAGAEFVLVPLIGRIKVKMEIVRALEVAGDNSHAPFLWSQLDCYVSVYPNLSYFDDASSHRRKWNLSSILQFYLKYSVMDKGKFCVFFSNIVYLLLDNFLISRCL